MRVTRISTLTGIIHTVNIPVSVEAMMDWENGMFIQKAMPDLTPAQREFILTGVTENEWNTYMTPPEDDS